MTILDKAFKNCYSLNVIEFKNNIDNVVNISYLPDNNLSKKFCIVISDELIKNKFNLFNGIDFSKIISKRQYTILQFKESNNYADIYLAVLHLKQIVDNEYIRNTINYLIHKYNLDSKILENTKEFIDV